MNGQPEAMDLVGSRRWFDDVHDRAVEEPGAMAVLDTSSNEGWTRAELWSVSGRIGNGLRARGLAGVPILLFQGNSLWYPALLLALHRAGSVVVVAGPWSKGDEIRFQIADAGCRAIITDEGGLATAIKASDGLPVITTGGTTGPGVDTVEQLMAARTDFDDGAVTPDTIASILYTSGTTGRPKGARFANGNYTFHGEVSQHLFGYGPWDTGLGLFPVSLAHGHFYQMVTWLMAGTRYVLAPFTASGFGNQVTNHGITVTSLNATHLKMIMARSAPDPAVPAALRFVKMGLLLPIEECHRFERDFGGPLVRSYSQTESVGPVISWRPGNRELDSVGRPVLGYEVSVWDADERPVPRGVPGHLVIRSQHPFALFQGYQNLEELTRAGFRGGWWRTGDLVTWREDGVFDFVGRISDIIKRKGFSVAAAEVERVLTTHPSVGEAAVIGLPDPEYEEEIVGFVVPRAGSNPEPEELLAFCAEMLADYKVPQRIVTLPDLPTDRLGKTDKRRLRAEAGG